MEDVVHENDMAILHRKWQAGRRDLGMQADTAEIVPVKGDIQAADRGGQAQ